MVTTLLGLLFGLLQGVRHAFEPDHLAAVSTLVAERRSARASSAYAAMWGVGHALVLLLVGGALLLMRKALPAGLTDGFELVVAFMLIALGVRALGRSIAAGRDGAPLPHRHGAATHAHSGHADHVHVHRWTLARVPLIVGCVHGLAGSGALTALVLSHVASVWTGLAYMMLYGAGAMIGMAGLAGLAGAPLARLVRTRRGLPVLLGVTGSLSLVLGVAWGWPVAWRLLAG